MKHIMILGIGPLAIDDSTVFHGGGNRAWHLAKPLLDHGFEVVLICMRITDKSRNDIPNEECHTDGKLTYYSVDELTLFANDDYLKDKIRQHSPDALVGACAYPSSRAVRVAGPLPVWADFHGYPMGEAQAKANQFQENGYLHHFWNIQRPALQRADRFSVSSERQRMALIGELGAMGRMNRHTFCEDLVTQIPIAWDEQTPYQARERKKDEPLIVMFSGGYNNWCDVETLFRALEIAMERDARIRFLSTGGAIDGHDETTYPRFEELVRGSKYQSCYDLRGWVSKTELSKCQARAHLGINVDLPCYETLIGARNRITEFIARGIPVLTTLGTEISQILFYKGSILTAPIGKPDSIANEMILAADHPDKMNEMAEKARKLFEKEYTYHTTVKKFLAWCEHPIHSGDFGQPEVQLDYSPFHQPPQREGTMTKKFLKMFK